MKAAVCYEFGKPLVVEEITIDPPQRGEVKVKLAATAICHSDVHLIRGEWGGDLPVVPGHEAAGIVAEVGEGVRSLQPGDHVVVSLLRNCGRCLHCMTGAPYLCDADFALDTDTRLRNLRGEQLQRGDRTAAFAEYTVVHETQCVQVPAELPLTSAALLACGVITGVGAVVNTAKVPPGSSVAVIGVGGVGLNAIQGARIAGARSIIAVDLLENKLAAARTFGATDTVNATEHEPVETVRARNGGRGIDYVFVTVGSSRAVEQGFDMIRPGGMVVVVGLPPASATVALNVHHFWAERHVVGSPMGSTRLNVDVPWLVELYRQGRLKLDELVTRCYPLEEVNEAIESMERGEALRNVIVF
ncbi:MAG: zinc-binding dehydrogenase [Chloroflexi bacterium]|nr:MAG: zinc-binding dehydrogenase [Chloroflexota bacterium]